MASPTERDDVRRGPALQRFLEASREAELLEDASESFWRLEDPLLRLLATDFLGELLTAELSALCRDPLASPVLASDTAWEIARTDRLRLRVLSFRNARPQASAPDAGARTLRDAARHRFLAPLWPSAVTFDRFAHDPAIEPEVFDPARALRSLGQVRVPRGQVLRLRARYDVAQLVPTQRFAVVLELASPQILTQRWTYDPETLRPQQAVAADVTLARLEHALRLLAHFGHRSAVPEVMQVAKHEAHYVRFAALQALAELDTDAALTALRSAADDPHPHVRTQAQRALASWEGSSGASDGDHG